MEPERVVRVEAGVSRAELEAALARACPAPTAPEAVMPLRRSRSGVLYSGTGECPARGACEAIAGPRCPGEGTSRVCRAEGPSQQTGLWQRFRTVLLGRLRGR
jgi:hypothetical protein